MYFYWLMTSVKVIQTWIFPSLISVFEVVPLFAMARLNDKIGDQIQLCTDHLGVAESAPPFICEAEIWLKKGKAINANGSGPQHLKHLISESGRLARAAAIRVTRWSPPWSSESSVCGPEHALFP